MQRFTKLAVLVGVGGLICGVALAALAGGTGSPSATPHAASASPSNSSTASSPAVPTTAVPTTGAASGECTAESILPMLPAGSTIESFECALGSPYMWAAVEVTSSSDVYFMRSNGPWELVDTSTACGSGDDRAPDELIARCPAS